MKKSTTKGLKKTKSNSVKKSNVRKSSVKKVLKKSVKNSTGRKIANRKPPTLKKKAKKTVPKKTVKKVSKKKIPTKKTKKTTKKKLISSDKKYESVLTKHADNPLISPNPENHWEAWQTFNPAAILIDGKVHFLYRAIGSDGLSRFGYANSSDAYSIDEKHPEPAYEDYADESSKYVVYSVLSGGSWGGCEDPRIVRVGNEDRVYVTYTSCKKGLRIGITSIKIKDLLNKDWNWVNSRLISPPGEVNKNWVIFPEKIKGKYAILHSISPDISVAYVDSLEFKEGEYIKSYYHPGKNKKRWDSFVRGPGPTPLKTKYGWLLLYHAMDHNDMSKYLLGAMILDSKNPEKILYRSKAPILVPDEIYELSGFKGGVVYATGAIIKDEELIVYYGGADSYVCAASIDLDKFLKNLIKESKKPVKFKISKKNDSKKK